MQAANPNDPIHRALGEVGRDVLGPIFCVFTDEVARRAAELGVERLLFLAREGWLLRDLYRDLVESPLPTSYLYVSRLSTSLPSVRALGIRELKLGLRRPGDSIVNLLASLDLYDTKMIALLHDAGIRDITRPIENPWNDPLCDALFSSEAVQREIAARAENARRVFRRYLEQEGLFASRRAALVDVGWSGTIQKNIHRAFANEPDYPDLRGLYLGALDGRWMGRDPDVAPRMEGLLYDYRSPDSLAARAIFYFVELFEQSARAPHGTTLGYAEQNGRVVPIVKERGADRAAEERSFSFIAAIQSGVREFACDWTSARSRLGATVVRRKREALTRLERFVMTPTRREVDAISRLVHTDDWGVDRHAAMFNAGALWSPRDWMNQLKRSYWKPGFVRATAGPIGARLYRLYARLKRPPI